MPYNLRPRQPISADKAEKDPNANLSQVTDEIALQIVEASGTSKVCPICIEPFTSLVELVPCGHQFDQRCAAIWHRKTNKCAVCRVPAEIVKTIVTDKNYRTLAWFLVDRFYVYVETGTGIVLSVGSNELNAVLVGLEHGAQVSSQKMPVKCDDGMKFIYQVHPRKNYYISDGNGILITVPMRLAVECTNNI